MKLGRTYSMQIEVSDTETVVVNYPLTLTFDLVRNTLGSANRGHFRILNLTPDTRRKIFHDRNQTLDYRRIRVQAGYEDQAPLPQIFLGNLLSAYSYREGSNWVTEIEALDGGYGILNGQMAQTVPSGWNLRQILVQAIGTMKNVTLGAVGSVDSDSARGVTLTGNSWNNINTLASSQNAQPFIDCEAASVLKRNEYIADSPAITLIDADTGLLETPRRSTNLLEATTIFEPRLRVGQRVQLKSLEAVYNGIYKVLGIAHRGTISGAVCGDLVTVASLDLGTATLVAVVPGS